MKSVKYRKNMKIVSTIIVITLASLLIINLTPSHSKLSKTVDSKNTISMKTKTLCSVKKGTEYTFDYTGLEQTFKAPCDGKYKLETWGAQGSSDLTRNINNIGGRGGYSAGTIALTEKENISINVGLGGKNNSEAGGEATYITTESGKLTEFEKKVDKVLMVAGGGGASGNVEPKCNGSTITPGGSGGGISGTAGTNASNSTASSTAGTGGTQTSGGLHGTGRSNYSRTYTMTNGTFGYGGMLNGSSMVGGMGFYGGGAGGYAWGVTGIGCPANAGSGGGSGYIGNSQLTDKHMACYNCETSNEESTKTISNACASETPTPDCSKIGNGYARITYLGN